MNSTDILNLVINELAANLTNSSHNNHHNSILKASNGLIDHDDDDHDHDHDHDHEHEHDDENSDKDIIVAKATAMAVLFCASTLCGCIPFLLNRHFKWTENNTNARSAIVVKCLLYFGGGVLLCTTFLHLLPEVKENIEALQSKHALPEFGFNFAELLMCLGFFAMFLVEELIHTYIHRHNKDAQNATGAFVRGVSINESILVKRKSNSSSRSSITTTASIRDVSTNNNNKKLKSDDIEKNQLDDNFTEIDLNKDKSITPIASSPPPTSQTTPSTIPKDSDGIINKSYEHEQNLNDNNSKNDSVYNRNSINKNNYYSDKNEHQKHEHHYKEHQTKKHNEHQNHGAHGHSHLPIGTLNDDLQEDAIVSSLRGLLIVLALSIHELFEGLAVGLESKTHNVWYMFGAVSAHKLVLAFCVGVELIVTRTKLWLAITYVITFAIVSPIGIGIGILVSSNDNTASAIPSAILQGLATGTLLYVVFFEILSKERSGLIPYASFVVGFFVMFGLQFATGHEHSHDHGHSHGNGHEHGHSHDSLKYQHNLNDDEIDYTKKSIQEQIEILRAAGKELLEKNQYQHHQQHHHEHNE